MPLSCISLKSLLVAAPVRALHVPHPHRHVVGAACNDTLLVWRAANPPYRVRVPVQRRQLHAWIPDIPTLNGFVDCGVLHLPPPPPPRLDQQITMRIRGSGRAAEGRSGQQVSFSAVERHWLLVAGRPRELRNQHRLAKCVYGLLPTLADSAEQESILRYFHQRS